MVLQHSSVGKSLLWHISYYYLFNAKVGTEIPTELCCNTIIHLLFYCIDPNFIFTLIIFNNYTSLFSFFCCGTASYNVTCISLLVFSTSVDMEKADTITYKHLAHFAVVWVSPYCTLQ